MFCKNCGAELLENASVCLKCGVLTSDGDKYCPNCGAEPDPKAVICVKCGYELHAFHNTTLIQNKNVHTFKEAVRTYYSNYANFSGRSCRAEYWFCYLFNIIIFWGSFAIHLLWLGLDNLLNDSNGEMRYIGIAFLCIGAAWSLLGNLLPTLAVTVRRLHDTGKSGWWYFIVFVPIIGGILLLIWMCQDSEHGINEYGKNPKGNENNQLYKLH